MKKKIVIIGAGMAGCFMGICLAKKGFEVEIYEERADIRKKPITAGRSFNLTLYYRGIQAMQKVEVWDAVKKFAVLAQGNVAHYVNNKQVFSPFDHRGNEVLYTIHRNQLNGTLLDIVENFPNVKLFFNSRCIKIDAEENTITLENEGKNNEIKTDLLIGADGVNSIVRTEIQRLTEGSEKLEYEDWGYKEVHVGEEIAQKLNLRSLSTHTWPRPESLLIAFPNPDKSFTLMFNLPLEGERGFSALNSETSIREYIITFFPDLMPLLSEIVHSFLNKPTGKFVTVTTSPWYYKDFMALIGDSAHGVLPFYGQGSCAAFDDCLTLSGLIDVHGYDWKRIFADFQQARKVNTDVLADLSKENFLELRDKSRSVYFILKDKIDTFLNRLFPNLWLPPLYVLIAHGHLPYSVAVKKHQNQEKIAKWTGINLILFLVSIPLKKPRDGFFIR